LHQARKKFNTSILQHSKINIKALQSRLPWLGKKVDTHLAICYKLLYSRSSLSH